MSMAVKVSYNIDWIIPSLRNPSKLWNLASTITVAAVGLFSKIIIGMCIHIVVFNQNLVTMLIYIFSIVLFES